MNTSKVSQTALNSSFLKRAGVVVVLCLLGGLLFAFRSQWLPHAKALLAMQPETDSAGETGSSDEGHGHEQGHGGDEDVNSIRLSRQAGKNIGLTTMDVRLQTFSKTISIPALVVERSGRSQIEVTSPLAARVSRVYPIQGEAITSGQPLFDLRMIHEDLVDAQSQLLRSAEELDVVMREIKRLESVSVAGAIPLKTIRDREYEKQKLEATINAQRQSLILHGVSAEQIDDILRTRTLLQSITVVAPPHPPNGDPEHLDHPFHIQAMHVKPGQYVAAGVSLCILADHHELYIEGRAFEQDLEHLNRVTNEGWEVTASPATHGGAGQAIEGLKILYLSDVVETDSRALHFYLRLPNRIIRDVEDEVGHRFVSWQYKPGQRMQVHVPVERWDESIVLPVDGVAQEGVETFVFEQNGDHFERVPVHVIHRDHQSAVIENDGRLLGATVAASGADQIQMALKNKAGGGVDPHAGHSH